MRGNLAGNDLNSWDTLESRLYNCFFGDADRVTDSYQHYGRYSQYESYEDNDNTLAYYRGSHESSNRWQYSQQTGGRSWPDDGVMTRQLQNMSITRAMIGQSWDRSYNSYLEDDEAIARELHQSYNSHLADDAAIARELQEMEDSLGSMSLYDGPLGSLTDSEWEVNRGGTSANRGGNSANPRGTSARAGHEVEVDLDNMSYEETSRFEESLGNVSKGLSQQEISRLPKHKYSPLSRRAKSGGETECVICKMEYGRGDSVMTLPCAHQYHEDCIKKWLEDHKDCCVCKVEVAV